MAALLCSVASLGRASSAGAAGASAGVVAERRAHESPVGACGHEGASEASRLVAQFRVARNSRPKVKMEMVCKAFVLLPFAYNANVIFELIFEQFLSKIVGWRFSNFKFNIKPLQADSIA